MRTLCIACLMALGVLQPRWCLAQPGADEARTDREMQEDVEVLRRIVTETVQDLYKKAEQRALRNCTACHVLPFGDVTPAAGMSDVANPRPHTMRERASKSTDDAVIRGLANYVPGGIVVQLDAPPPVVDRDVKPWLAADEAVPKRWDVLLRETRGEPEKKSVLNPLLLSPEQRRVHHLILTEKVVEALAENGRNLRHLGPEERVTVAFTFPPPSPENRERERATLLHHYFANASSGGGSSGSGTAGASGLGSGAGSSGSANLLLKLGEDSDPRSAALSQAMTGDLLMRQEKYAEAIAAYEKALAAAGVKLKDRVWDPDTGESRRPPVPDVATDLTRKLIQAQVGAKNFSEARALLQWLEGSQASSDELVAMRRIYLDLVGAPPTPEETKAFLADTRADRREILVDRLLAAAREDEGPSRVPARMVISCTRQQLDDVASGKLTKLEFAGKITLKYYKALAAEKKALPAKK